MWNPYSGPASSFVEPVPIPAPDSQDAPLICLQLNASWLPYVLGCLMQLVNPATWDTTDPAALQDIQQRAMDLIGTWGTAEACVAPELRLTDTCGLQLSTDGGATWTDVAGWATNFPTCVAANTPRIQMQPGESFPPIPEVTTDGTDYVYLPPFP